jgi:hypothetical protein
MHPAIAVSQEPHDWEQTDFGALLSPISDNAALPIDFWSKDDPGTTSSSTFSDNDTLQRVDLSYP